MKARIALAAMIFALASCGRVSELQPEAGRSLPQKPALASRALTADELLELPTRADPRRVDELSKRGDIRQADRFDLPPPDGEAVAPIAGNEPSTPGTTGPDNQEPQRR